MTHETILIFDFGSQFAQLIARRVRELNVYCQIVRHDLSAERVRELTPKGIILSGGPASVYEAGAPQIDPAIFDLGIPVLGICYGMQLLCRALGGDVGGNHHTREYGRAILNVSQAEPLFAGVPAESTVWMSHGDQVRSGSAFAPLASTATCPLAAVRHESRPLFGLQFHPEVMHTEHGGTILKNFLTTVAGCRGEWKMASFIDDTVYAVKARVGTKRVICGLSGGVDSAVCAALLLKAIGPQLACIYVDTGMMREGETETVKRTFRDWYKADLHVVEAGDRFLAALAGVTDPQLKRKIIGKLFIDIFKDEARSIPDAHFLAQGTLYPDVIESGGSPDGPAATIKLHHNVGGLPAELGFDLVEPLRDLFKDEVRRLGSDLGLPDDLVWRHPFPGPGLAVRCLGDITKAKLDIIRQVDTIFLDELHRSGWYRKTSQAFAVLLPVQSVGVMGDGRTYENTVALRCVQTDDFMTADWSRLPYDLLATVSTNVINRVKGVNRVVYDISSKPPATIEWE
jgi:GMP synthase (glutamine-hydrolysing)